MPRAVVDIGDCEFATGLAFGAFSRVKAIDGLVLARDINPARLRDADFGPNAAKGRCSALIILLARPSLI